VVADMASEIREKCAGSLRSDGATVGNQLCVADLPELMMAGRMDEQRRPSHRGHVRHRSLQSLVRAKRWRWAAVGKPAKRMAFGSSVCRSPINLPEPVLAEGGRGEGKGTRQPPFSC
jgi:hypothetical protein